MGYLRFVNFTGSFSASYQDAGATGPRRSGDRRHHLLRPGVSDYNLGGAEVILCAETFDGSDSYYTFVVGGVPQSEVHVVPN